GDRLPDAVLRQAGAKTAVAGGDRAATRDPAVPGVRLPVAGLYVHGRRRAPRVRQIDRKRSSRPGERDRAAAAEHRALHPATSGAVARPAPDLGRIAMRITP